MVTWREAAEKGSAEGQWLFGRCLDIGSGVKKDEVESLKWFRKSADQGFGLGENAVGLAYANGAGVAKDPVEAVKWFRKSADRGEAAAQMNLADMYSEGTGVEENKEEAFKWSRKAAEQDFITAQFSLGWKYEKSLGVAGDMKEAVKWYRKASDQGEGMATVRLVAFLEEGIGVPKDAVEATRLRARAKQQLGDDAEEELRVAAIQYRPWNKRAPEAAGTIDGKQFKLSEHRGKVVVLKFGATWCGPCRAMLPHQKELVKRLAGEPFVLLDVDTDKNSDLASRWNIRTIPAIFVIDPEGMIRTTNLYDKDLDRKVDMLLKEAKEKRPKEK
jgi:thiol-disulfide isomerase/thioredoxin